MHELASELGVTIKEILTRLKELGEFVKSASSTLQAPVARRLRECYGIKYPAKGLNQSVLGRSVVELAAEIGVSDATLSDYNSPPCDHLTPSFNWGIHRHPPVSDRPASFPK